MRAWYLRKRGVQLPAGPLIPPHDQRCDICGSPDPGGRGGWHADHDHATHTLRGWLCHDCNTGIGKLKDCPETLACALVYLAAHGRALTTEQLGDFLAVYDDAPPVLA